MAVTSKIYHVLIVDDDPATVDLLSRRLERYGYEVSGAHSAAEAEAIIGQRRPDIILLDLRMPEVSGLEFLRRLRSVSVTRSIPVIMVSNADDTESIVAAIKDGANDYVTKPVNMSVLLARMEMHLRMVSMFVNLETQGAILARLAAYDELTGIYNRRSLFDALDAECARSRRNGHHLSVLMIDIDFFKRVNDDHGHAAGDATLREVAQRLSRALRTMDCLGRYGGEEFCAVLPETNVDNSLRTAERLRMAVADSPFRIGDSDAQITISIGAATRSSEEAGDPVGLLNSADRALLEAKRLGRNRVCHTAQEAVS